MIQRFSYSSTVTNLAKFKEMVQSTKSTFFAYFVQICMEISGHPQPQKIGKTTFYIT